MVRSIPSPLDERPKAFNCVGVSFTIGIPDLMIDRSRLVDLLGRVIATVFVGDQQRTLRINVVFQEGQNAFASQVRCNSCGNPATAFYCPNDWSFACSTASRIMRGGGGNSLLLLYLFRLRGFPPT